MRRGPKPAKSKEAKPPTARKSPKSDSDRMRDLEKRLAEALSREAEASKRESVALGQLQTRDRELGEALEQQIATSEILRMISNVPPDLQPVLESVANNAARVCGAYDATVVLREGDFTRRVAHYGPIAADYGVLRPLSAGYVANRAILEGQPIHVYDILTPERGDLSDAQAAAPDSGYRTMLAVPLLREGDAIGALTIRRREVQPFTDKQIALLQTFADQAVIAIENVRLFNETKEALERQTATGDILKVIASSPTDVQPVFDAITESAARLCGVADGWIVLTEGDTLRGVSAVGQLVGQLPDYNARRVPLTRESVIGRAILDRTTIHIDDLAAASEAEYPEGRALQRMLGHRTQLVTPLLREGVAIGVILLARFEVRLFSERQIELLRTFADQAVIAIENVRLFTETKEALEQQTATGDILKVIASSPTDVQPVLDAVAESAARLCGAVDAIIQRVDGDTMRRVAHFGAITSVSDARAVTPGTPSGRAILERQTTHIDDILDAFARGEYLETRALQQGSGFRTVLAVPLMREHAVIGVITIRRLEVRPFTTNQMALLKTFADQAVIAIENVRLFTELQEKNRALTEAHAEVTQALDRQTATSGILRAISQSQTDAAPVFEAIVDSAVRLLRAYTGGLTRVVGEQIVLEAFTRTDAAGDTALQGRFPMPVVSDSSHALTLRDRAPLNVADADADPRLSVGAHRYARVRGYRSQLVVPLLRQADAIGTISVTRREPGGFEAHEIALIQTFADQAVIAIENARLLTELQARTQDLTRSVGQLTALGEVGRAVSSTLDLETVLSTIVSRAIQLSGTDGGSVYEYDEATEEFSLRASRDLPEAYVEQVRDAHPRKGEGAVGRVAQTREPVQIADISDAATYESRVRNMLLQIGLRALLAVPLIAEDRLVGALIVMRKRTGTFAAEEVALLQTFATQSALAIQNARLFREIEDKSRQLEVASQHKSEFLANMSHELRTPLNAIIGFSEVLSDRMFGGLNEKQEEYLKDIHASGQHLLSLINDILDLSKIEAGRMELELTEFDFPNAIENALMLVRERAGRRSIALQTNIDNRLGPIQADERKVRQVVLNLLSNAIKFTPEGGRIEVGAVPRDGAVVVSVSDTGVGIAAQDLEAVFEEFRQVGTAEKKAEGTGLGLTLCRKFIELHAGRIWVKSQVGVGSTFTFTIPVRRGE